MSDVIRFWPKNAAENPDAVLEQAVGNYTDVFVIGYDREGCLDARASLSFEMRDIFFAIEAFKHMVLRGEYGDRLMERGDE